jgi:hypothetical protein
MALVGLVLERMGQDYSNSNAWALALRDIISKHKTRNFLSLTEIDRNNLTNTNLEKIEHILKIICRKEKKNHFSK